MRGIALMGFDVYLRPEEVRHDVDMVTPFASIFADAFVRKNAADLSRCSPSDMTMLLLRATMLWLVSNGLVIVATDSAFEQMVESELREPHASEWRALVEASIANRSAGEATSALLIRDGAQPGAEGDAGAAAADHGRETAAAGGVETGVTVPDPGVLPGSGTATG